MYVAHSSLPQFDVELVQERIRRTAPGRTSVGCRRAGRAGKGPLAAEPKIRQMYITETWHIRARIRSRRSIDGFQLGRSFVPGIAASCTASSPPGRYFNLLGEFGESTQGQGSFIVTLGPYQPLLAYQAYALLLLCTNALTDIRCT